MVFTIPDGIREGMVSEQIPKGNKKAKLAEIWEESIPRRDSTAEAHLVYLPEARRPGL